MRRDKNRKAVARVAEVACVHGCWLQVVLRMQVASIVDATLVVASCASRLHWLQPLTSIFSIVVMEQCSHLLTNSSRPDYPTIHVRRCGREAHSYLAFIIQRWGSLPAHVIFMQSDAHKHCGRNLSGSNLLTLLESNLTFSMLPGSGTLVPSSCQVDWVEVLELQQLVANVSRPVTSHTFAHFYATRERIRGRPLELYTGLARRFSSEKEGFACGTGAATSFERMWPLVFGCAEPVRSATDAIYRPTLRDFIKACGCGPRGDRSCQLAHPGFCCLQQTDIGQLVRGEASPEGCAGWHDTSAFARARYNVHYGQLTRATPTGFEPFP